ncbi:tRNA-specific 2-thiouridylase MnmA, partial [Golovinomyces cichoracearum]
MLFMNLNKNKKVIVAMSGGVDSSVSAWILKQKKYQVEEFWDNVFKHFLNEYKNGKTPNPDVLCNKEIKFNLFLKYSITNLKADYIATGHYARIKKMSGKHVLLKGVDLNKDQTYFLYTLNNSQLKKILFPIGSLNKNKVRDIAKKLNLTVAEKKDSTGICFIGAKKLKNFLNQYISEKQGDIITIDGKKIGKHYGAFYYTLGQRKGLGIGGIKGEYNIPWYVVDKNIKKNILIVAQGSYNKHLMSIGLIAKDIHWINDIDFSFPFLCMVKTRYRQKNINCNIQYINQNNIKILFEFPVAAVTPGQSVVLYLSDEIIVIKKINSITLSLAGICQSVYLVQSLAYSGKCDNHSFKICLESILQTNPTSVISIYGNNKKNLIIGLQTLISILGFSNFSYSYIEFMKYIFGMIILEKKLQLNNINKYSLKKKLSTTLEKYSINYDINVLVNELANIYVEIISSLGSRISIKGIRIFLQNLEIQKKIRCLLLAGIRSIVLWKQFGGNELKLIFFRYDIIKKAKKML